MGDMGGPGGSAALSGDLYEVLRWQALLLVVVMILVLAGLALLSRRGGAAPADTELEHTGRRVLRIALGVLWVVAGLLQAQPAMPASFVQANLNPALASAPDAVFAVIDPFARLWLQHPVAADAVTVWLQIGLGVGVLVGGSGRLARAVLVASASWAAFVWVVGEVLGGLADPQASWLSGAPGAALFYVVASLVLLAPASFWALGRAQTWLRRVVGATMLVGAVLQAMPRSGYWTPTGLFNLFSDVAMSGVPAPAAAPIQSVATALPPVAGVANSVIVLALVIVGTGLLAGVWPRFMISAGIVGSLLAWWFGQGFGIFGGTATDTNSGIVVALLLLAAWPWPDAVASPVADEDVTGVTEDASRWTRTVGAALALAALVVLPLVASVGLIGEQTAQAAVGDSGGITATTPEPAPPFTLTDQDGRTLRMADLQGTLTMVVFLDPECFDSCPLIANELATAVKNLGPDASSVSILAVDVNPVFNHVADVRTFTVEHGLDSVPGWHFVTGSTSAVGDLLAAYGEGISVPNVGMIGHPQTIYLFDREGREIATLNDTANDDLIPSYVELIATALRRHL
jgi:cytochrome oxidase Cu insertion factor (SCO1/SenC/PrrC family)